MPTYRAEVPIVVISSQRNDRLGSQTSWRVRIDGELLWQGQSVRLTSEDGGTIRAVFDAVPAASQGEAYARTCEALSALVPLLSLESQREHLNRHYGPLRATWSRAELRITPADEWPSMSVALRSERRVEIAGLNDHLAAFAAIPDLRPLLLSYDRALAPDDEETRFFNAFAIVEFVEKRFATSDRFTRLLDDAGADAVIEAMEVCVRARQAPPNILKRLTSLVGGSLRRGTIEGREFKLLKVLRDDFGIARVEDAIGPVDVDIELVRQLTDARNRLFHGAAGEAAGFVRLTDRLTLIVEQILRAFLERRVALPPAA
jgi:hypothetical protein